MTDLWAPPRPDAVFLTEDQRQYQAEEECYSGEFAYLSPFEARSFAADLCNNEELRAIWPYLPTKIQIRYRRRHKNEPLGQIAVTYGTFQKDLFALDIMRNKNRGFVSCWTLVHEFAHHSLPFTEEFHDHGPEFATNLLVMAGIVFGRDAFDRLGLEYRNYGVPIQPDVTSVTLTS